MTPKERYAEANAAYKKSWSDESYVAIRRRYSKATAEILNNPSSVAAVAAYISAKAAYDEREALIARLLREREAIYAEMHS